MKALIIISFIFTLLSGCAGVAPINLGVHEEQLAPCPSSPNCVSSFAQDEHKIEAIKHLDSLKQARTKLLDVLKQFENAQIITDQERYIRCEFTSRIFGFVDDVEFLIQSDLIHVRSASRLGYSDLGVNRDRIEAIRQAFTTQ